ncbi:hypothetical protein ACWEKT_17755 [Nocardia takedensis]
MVSRVKARLLGRALRVAAGRAAAPGDLRFTEGQLYYELCRTLTPVPRGLRPGFTVAAPVSFAEFRASLDEHGPVPGLLLPEPARPRSAGAHTSEPDLFDYGLPRLLVCESDAVAQMLRANGIPMESACPVFGAGELPLDPRVARMLTLTERPTVFVLHDATPAGLEFPMALPDLAGLPDGVRVAPLGLRPRQAFALHLTHRGGPGSEPSADLDLAERAWLRRGRFAEVEAVRPASLLRTVHRLVREVRPRVTVPLRHLRAAGFLTWPSA